MNDIRTIEAHVYDILENHPTTRNSDNELYYVTCKTILEDKGIDIDDLGFKNVILSVRDLGLPQYETVGRARRKIQQHNPSLRGCKTVEEGRISQMDVFAEYALEGVGV